MGSHRPVPEYILSLSRLPGRWQVWKRSNHFEPKAVGERRPQNRAPCHLRARFGPRVLVKQKPGGSSDRDRPQWQAGIQEPASPPREPSWHPQSCL